ncbi:MAG TPA: xanthine dehydrogenase, partial [Acetobacteraceae bacterium]
MTPEILAALEAAREQKRPVVVATKLPSGEQRLLPDPSAPDAMNEIARQVLISDISGTHKIGGDD